MEPIIGIDLGTTNSEVAFIFDDRVEVIKEKDSGLVPSCAGIDENGSFIVGAQALNQAVVAPDRTIQSVKRKMGSSEKIYLNEQPFSPQEISALILKELKKRAERVCGFNISRAVITTPAYFTDAQRQATREAGEIAGLKVERILNEPTAAAIAYEKMHPDSRSILVYDLGGGTFDVSIVKIDEEVVEVLTSTGDNHLGGDDFDQAMADHLLEYISSEFAVDLKADPLVRARLKRAAEKAKIELSREPYAMIEEDHLGGGVHLRFEFSRSMLEDLIREDLNKTMTAVDRALQDAALCPSDIDKIILVGGASRIPAISELLEKKFGRRPHQEIDPDLCVAMGAGIQAGRIMGLSASGVLLDITPYTFGTSALGPLNGEISHHCYVPIIRRNTKLPVRHTEAFCTVCDDQEAVEINVFQGENPHALDNILIGDYFFELTPQPMNSVITLNFDLDINGILKIKAVEKATGREITGEIKNAFAEFSKADIAASREKLVSPLQTFGDDPDDHPDLARSAAAPDSSGEIPAPKERKEPTSKPDIPTDLQETLAAAQAALTDAPADDRDEIINLIEDMQEALKAKDMEKARAAGGELEDILFYLE